jgi:hypothetical protein
MYGLVHSLAKGNIFDMNKATELKLTEAFAFLTYEKLLAIAEKKRSKRYK